MKENLNPQPNSLKEAKQSSDNTQGTAKPEETSYDLTDVGDAALLAVLSEKESANPESLQDSKNSQNSQDSQDSQDSQNPQDSAPSQASSVNLLLSLALKLLSGEVPEERLLQLMDAAHALEAIEAARKEGETAGRNSVIEERLRPVEIGAPDLNGAPSPTRHKTSSIFDLALDAR